MKRVPVRVLGGVLPVVLAAMAAQDTAPCPAESEPGDGATSLVVRVEGARNSEGLVQIALFRTPEGFPEEVEHAAHTASVPPREPLLEVRFDGVEPGPLAVAVLHDENENGRLDRNFLGIPREGVGASNDAVRFGLPRFDSARILVPEEGAVVMVTLRYWL